MFGFIFNKKKEDKHVPVVRNNDLDKLRAEIHARHGERAKERAEIVSQQNKQFEEVDNLSTELESINNRLRSLTR
jgi:hypothetical protein